MQNDDRLTFLLPRPVWVSDIDVSYCSSCNSAFGPLKRRHHCRNCGNIFCHECSARNVPLPQLGYGTKPVRVCNGCFDVAYLVTYAIDEDHGISTQMHGVRGLLELTEKDDEKDLHNMVAYGGVDALIWLCRSSKSIKLHHLTTTILAMLAEKESIRPVIITKWALPPLLSLIHFYTNLDCTHYSSSNKRSPSSSILSATSPSINSDPACSDSSTLTESRQSILLEIVINCTHILYQLSRAGILSQKEVIQEGVFDILLMLASFSITDQSDEVLDRVNIVQSLAAKAISAISSLVSFQASMIELVQGTDKLPTLLRSSNEDVRKYMAKTIAYLSLRNDKYKPALLNGNGSRALVSILATLPQKLDIDKQSRLTDLAYYLSKEISDMEGIDKNNTHLYSATVSHTCCALANFATNNESQVNLMSQPHILQYICNVPATFPTHTEIHRHVARCLANLALYEENNQAMLATATTTDKHQGKDAFNVVPTLLLMGKEASSDVQRHIVRAIDNLNSHVSLDGNHWQDLFSDAYVYINKILEKNEKDDDTVKRAKSILAREKALKSSTELSKSNQEDNEQVSLDNDATAADEVDKVTEALEEVSLEVPNGGIIVTASSIEEDEDEDNINENRKAPKTSKNERKSKKNKQ